SRANAFALLLTPIIRATFDGCVPLALIEAPQPGTGKTLLAKAIAIIATGRTAELTTMPSNEDEWRKKITSLLMSGTSLIVWDNVVAKIASAELAAVLTTTVWNDRMLGASRQLSLPNRATWIATGNNIRLGGDIPRRCYPIRLDANVAQPWMRSGFRHPDLL